MKKFLRVFLVLSLALVVVFAFSACNKVEPEEAFDEIGNSFENLSNKIETEMAKGGIGFCFDAGVKIKGSGNEAIQQINNTEFLFNMNATVDKDSNVKFDGALGTANLNYFQLACDGEYVYLTNNLMAGIGENQYTKYAFEDFFDFSGMSGFGDIVINDNFDLGEIEDGITTDFVEEDSLEMLAVIGEFASEYLKEFDLSSIIEISTSSSKGVKYYTISTKDNFLKSIMTQVATSSNKLVDDTITAINENKLDTEEYKLSNLLIEMFLLQTNAYLPADSIWTKTEYIEYLKDTEFAELEEIRVDLEGEEFKEILSQIDEVINELKLSFTVGIKNDIVTSLSGKIVLDINQDEAVSAESLKLDLEFNLNFELKSMEDVQISIPTNKNDFVEVI